MDSNEQWFKIICIICIIILIIISQYIISKNTDIILQKDSDTDDDLLKFYTDFRFEQSSNDIDIEGQYDCSTIELKECDIDDYTSCAGCKSLNATCHHFNEDVIYYNEESEIEYTIPKNIDPNKGYCMNLTTIADGCSPQGDYAIIQTGINTFDYFLVCMCKNPGLIGNTSLNGNCSTVHVCNGQIDDLNKPLSEINCLCNEYQISDRHNNIPYCRNKRLEELNANEINKIYTENGDRLIPLSYFNITIQQNLPENTQLADPCTHCAITGEIVNAQTYIDDEGNAFCREIINTPNEIKKVVIIDSNNVNGRILKGNIGGDLAIGLEWTVILTITGQNAIVKYYYVCELKNNSKYSRLFNNKSTIYIQAPSRAILNYHFAYNIVKGLSSGPLYEQYGLTWKVWMMTQNTLKRDWYMTILNNTYNIYYYGYCTFPFGCGPWNEFSKQKFQLLILNEKYTLLMPPPIWFNYMNYSGMFHLTPNGNIDIIYMKTKEQANWLKERSILKYDDAYYLKNTDIEKW